MVTHDFTSTTDQEEPETALLPTYPHFDEEHHPQRDAELPVTPTSPGANFDPWPVVTDEAAITAVQPQGHSVTGPGPCNAMDVAALRHRIAATLATIDQYRPAWSREDDDDGSAPFPALLLPFPGKPRTGGAAAVQPVQADLPSLSFVAEIRGKLWLSTWGDLYELPRCMWEEESNGPAQIVASVPVVQPAKQLQEALTC